MMATQVMINGFNDVSSSSSVTRDLIHTQFCISCVLEIACLENWLQILENSIKMNVMETSCKHVQLKLVLLSGQWF
jgi:hypothetical protein